MIFVNKTEFYIRETKNSLILLLIICCSNLNKCCTYKEENNIFEIILLNQNVYLKFFNKINHYLNFFKLSYIGLFNINLFAQSAATDFNITRTTK